MAMMSCPMCGRQVSRRYFSPEDLDVDVLGVERQSLGRAKGFRTLGYTSIRDDTQLMTRISARCRVLLSLLDEEEYLDEEGIQGLRDRIVDLQRSVDEYKNEVEVWEAESEELVLRVNNAFNAEFKEIDDAVSFLLEVALE